MTLGVLIALLAGTVIPALTAAVTRETASARMKAAIAAVFSVSAGAVATVATTPPRGTSQWEQLVGTILLAWVASASAYSFGWKPTGAVKVIVRATAGFGIGPRSDTG